MVGGCFLFNEFIVPTEPVAATFEHLLRDGKESNVVSVEPTVGDVAIDKDCAHAELSSACVSSSSSPYISNIVLRASSASVTTCQF